MNATQDFNLDKLDWGKQNGLIPAIVQDAESLQVRMLGYMNREALAQTMASGEVVFFSRSRQSLWRKGERSGHVLHVLAIETDCDADSLLIRVRAVGPTCHLGRASCFADAAAQFIGQLDTLLQSRERERPANSYSTQLFESGLPRMAQKVGEEGVETALAAVTGSDDALLSEAADLVFHLLVLLRAKGLGWTDLDRLLAARHKP